VFALDPVTRTGSFSCSSSVSCEAVCLRANGVSGGDGRFEIRSGMVGESLLISALVLFEINRCKDSLCEEVSLVVVLDSLSRRVNGDSKTVACTELFLVTKGSTRSVVFTFADNL
jgi:hypothetical protein